MLLIVSISDLKPEFRDGYIDHYLSHLGEAAERAAIYCSTVILQNNITGIETVLKRRDVNPNVFELRDTP